MSYTAEISRRNPTCLLFLVDQSGSMNDTFAGSQNISKASFLADVMNRILRETVIDVSRGVEIRDYFWIGVIGYGETVGPALAGGLAGRELVPISELAANPARVEERKKKESDGAGGIIEVDVKFPVWFDAHANGSTPMCEALGLAQTTLQRFVGDHPGSFPPIIMHLTDGESTDGDPTSLVEQLTSLSTEDGNVLVFNCHISSRGADPIRFPVSDDMVPQDPFARMLFRMSSLLPSPIIERAREAGVELDDMARGFVFNGGMEEIVSFFDIGTQYLR